MAIDRVGQFIVNLIDNSSIDVKKARDNHKNIDFTKDLILVDDLGMAIKKGTSDTYNGTTEIMSYSDYYIQMFTIDFYGNNASSIAKNFITLLRTQKSYDLQSSMGLSFSLPRGITDLKQLTGTTYQNRLQIEAQVGYWDNIDMSVLRIDTAEIIYTTDDSISMIEQ